MRKKIGLSLTMCAMAIAVSGCANNVNNEPNHQGAMDFCKARITKDLKDPDSVKFTDVGAEQITDTKWEVNGLYNAKNSYGGYTGNAPFSCEIKAVAGDNEAIYNITDYSLGE